MRTIGVTDWIGVVVHDETKRVVIIGPLTSSLVFMGTPPMLAQRRRSKGAEEVMKGCKEFAHPLYPDAKAHGKQSQSGA